MVDITNTLKNIPKNILFKGFFGFEKENLRIKTNGEISNTHHDDIFTNKSTHPYITTDFSDSQVEMITPPCSSIQESLGFLKTIHDIVTKKIGADEILWPQSMPPILPDNEEDISIARYHKNKKNDYDYRVYLSKKYGRKVQLISGVHFNFSFDDDNLAVIYDKLENQNISFREFKENIYLKISRNFLKYRWFLTALLGNSPVAHSTYPISCIQLLNKLHDNSYYKKNGSSLRMSGCGYKNTEDIILDYSSYTKYKQSINRYVDKSVIIDERENYSPIRLKEANNNLYLEVRLIDLNPTTHYGIDLHSSQIVHMFLIFCLIYEDTYLDEKEQIQANRNQEIAADNSLSNDANIIIDNTLSNLQQSLTSLYKNINNHIEPLIPTDYLEALNYLEKITHNLELRPGYLTIEKIKQSDFIDWHINQALEYKQHSLNRSYSFHSLEDMELSTKLILRECINRGIKFTIMDRTANCVKLEKNNKVEYIFQATKTSIDNYSSILIMENKLVTKAILNENHINTPKGNKPYLSIQDAKNDFPLYLGINIVIKPQNTNFGLGISILKNNTHEANYDKAIELAFKHDHSILIEEFVHGKEYRFFIIDNNVVAVLNRVPANVTGDGVSNIYELVDKKNLNPLRGTRYQKPLEKISLGEVEKMFLEMQGLNFNSIIPKDKIIYLRENSNISTGGDSIDFTDEVHHSYKKIAQKAAQILNVRITGLDMIIKDIYKQANDTNYSIIEMNFNPAIHMHCFPYIGKNRHLDKKILDALGF